MYNTDPSKLWALPLTISNIAQWHHSRNLVEGSDDPSQMLKLVEELGELAGNVARGRDIKDDVGDMIVVLTNICERNGLSLADCALTAYNDIKDRKGRMVEGVFVKEEDLVE